MSAEAHMNGDCYAPLCWYCDEEEAISTDED